MLQEPSVRRGDALAQPDPRPPAEIAQPARIHELARRTVRLARVERDAAAEPDCLADEFGELEDAELLAGSHIDRPGLMIVLEDVDERRGAVVDMHHLAQRLA